jgi:RNA recognition motif. (a.k.a. RRM, RBD, or RNP domain)
MAGFVILDFIVLCGLLQQCNCLWHDICGVQVFFFMDYLALCVVLITVLTSSLQVNGMLLEGKKVYVGPFQKSDERPASHEQRYTNVFVKNLPDSVDDKELLAMFGEYGSVTSAVVMKVCH